MSIIFFSICTYAVSLFLASLCPSIYCPASNRMFTGRCLCVIIRQSRSTLSFYMCGPLSAYLLCLSAFIFDNPNFFFKYSFLFVYFLVVINNFFFSFIDFDGYYVRTDEGQPRPKYIFNKCGTNIYLFLLYRGLVHHHHRNLN